MNHATVIAAYGRRMRLRLADEREVGAKIKGKRLRPVCGDIVEVTPLPGENDWLITGIGDRLNALTRPNLRGEAEVLAANIDYVLVVAAAEPKPDWFIVDRYLCAAETMGVDSAVVFNKIDLVAEPPEAELLAYRRIGYEVVTCSSETGERVGEICKLLGDRCAIIVGQSGVGKSSIINSLAGERNRKTAAVSGKSKEGRHTTVSSVMIALPGCGRIIDSPGVRDYAPALGSSTVAAQGFREIRTAGAGCRFANCRHLREPGCGVKADVESGAISPRRYESYKRTVNLTKQLAEGGFQGTDGAAPRAR
ncbi:MAG: ribosome small subunit-dependent GTPase A [Proteobacteria bacterium]|nr:ribosome small subunit-dependent GTPase A [Pseudomonadota bacterium]